MSEPAAIVDAIRAGARLRDKLLVIAIEPGWEPELIDVVAADLGLVRAFGAKVIVVAGAGRGPKPIDAQAPALRLHTALAKHEERGVLLPATGLVKVDRGPAPARGAAPVPPTPTVNVTLFLYLMALGYVPIRSRPRSTARARRWISAPARSGRTSRKPPRRGYCW